MQQQQVDVNQPSSLISKHDETIWAYSRWDLDKILKKVKESQQEHLEVLHMTHDSLFNKEDGSNGLEDFGISRGTNSNDEAYAMISERSSGHLQKMHKVEERILGGKYTSICSKCGEHIALVRLMFIPETRVCNFCAR